ncbi:uncharacterized protein [Nicotiana sylvestris]|uniref:uncharacterized protein n=1 Tax=Nicotiana sylvestris TaxID=4096 RepID=UPI00388CE602
MTRKVTTSQKGKAVADKGMSRVPMSSEGQSEAPRGNMTPTHSSPISPAPEEMRRNPVPPIIVQDEDMDMRSAVRLLTRLVAAQAQHRLGTCVGHIDRVISTRVRDFINLDPLEFTGSNKDEDHQNFIDRIQKTLRVMHASDTELVELASYRLWDLAVQWHETWELSRGTNASPAVWEEFSGAFFCHYLPAEIRQARVDRFLALKQGNISVREYSLQFDSLARYAPSIVVEMSDQVHRFVVGLGPHLINECFTVALLNSMDISRIQAYAQNLEDRKRQQYENRDEGQRKKARSARQPEDFSGNPMPPYPVDSV